MWQLFAFFLQMGIVSFGGGYALIPLIEKEAMARDWMTSAAFIDAVAVAGTAPGPIAVNLATIAGYRTFGIGGAAAAIAGLLLPSLLIAALFMFAMGRLNRHKWIARMMYGLQPVVVALILYAVYRLGIGRLGPDPWDTQLLFGLLLIAICWILLTKYRMHPVYILLFSAIGGMAFL